MRDITVTVVARIVIISRIVLTVITQALWSLSVTGKSGSRRTFMLDDMAVERFCRHKWTESCSWHSRRDIIWYRTQPLTEYPHIGLFIGPPITPKTHKHDNSSLATDQSISSSTTVHLPVPPPTPIPLGKTRTIYRKTTILYDPCSWIHDLRASFAFSFPSLPWELSNVFVFRHQLPYLLCRE